MSLSDKTGEFGKDFMKVKFDADDDLLLNKPLKFPTVKKKMVQIIRKFI